MENEWPMPMQNDIRKVRVSAALVGEIVYTSAQIYIYIYIYIYRERERERERERGGSEGRRHWDLGFISHQDNELENWLKEYQEEANKPSP